jgi:hypothetical protein|tara:strand:+ start:376 stop:732 length:357 start_codon:yes stop_codon:yes gene_type:complete
MKSVVLFILFSLTLHTSNKNTPKSWGKGLAVVQYNADFNKNNSVKNLQRLSDARIFNAWIDKQPELKTENRIKSVPTIILYNDGEEVRRWEAGIMMKLDITHHEIQEYIDELTGANKF